MNKLQERYPLIIGEDNPILRTPCSPIKKITPEIRDFGKDLITLMHEYDGVGLAAPQIGELIRMAAFVQLEKKNGDRAIIHEGVMINPEILAHSDDEGIDEEGCLSLPKTFVKVSRRNKITVQYIALNGKKVIRKAEGYNARIILHEMDHLDGVLMLDK